jgi:ATP phosphoribosyltransferase
MKRLKIALPSGSLFEATLNLLARVGMVVKFGDREFMVRVENKNLTITFILDRPQDIPLGILRGAYDAGICGLDCVVESGLEAVLVLISELAYAKKSRRIVEVVIFGKADRLIDAENIVVATEFMNLARAYFKKAKLVYSHGCTESKVLYGGYHFGVCITETGKSLEANGLKIVKTILRSPTVLIAKEEMPEIKIFGEILCGALAAEKQVILKFDCAKDIKDDIVAGLPAIESPTVNQLSDGNFAIETVIAKDDLANQLIRLKLAGATGIIVQDFNILL